MSRKHILLIAALLLLSAPGRAVAIEEDPGPDRASLRRWRRLETLVRQGAAKLPEDMVVYRYADDSLVSWTGTFPVFNDDISAPGLDAWFSGFGKDRSELSAIPDSAVVMRLGGRRFLVKSESGIGTDGTRLKTIYGLRLPAPKAIRTEMMRSESLLSPMLYSGAILHSLLSVIIVNLLILALCLAFLLRFRVLNKPVAVFICCALAVYTFFALRSIILNSDICLELYRLSSLSVYTAVVYLSFLSIILCVPALLKAAGIGVFSGHGRIFYAVLVGIAMLLVTSGYGLVKEREKIEVWACRLALDRDLSLEMQLRESEMGIADDEAIPQMVEKGVPSPYIVGYLLENFFPNLEQDYEVAVLGIRRGDRNPDNERILAENVGGGTAISPSSRFRFAPSGTGRIRYTALFEYGGGKGAAPSGLLLGIEYRINNENRGYASILGITSPGKVEIPSGYSYAKYNGMALQFFKGGYPYPTNMNERQMRLVFAENERMSRQDGYLHFPTRVNENETVIISRPVNTLLNHIHAAAFIAVITFLLLTVIPTLRKRPRDEERSYYRRRISVVLMLAMTLSLVFLTFVSIYFVYRSNERNLREMMSDKVNSIRSLMEKQLAMAPMGPDGIQPQDIMSVMKAVAEVADTDISLFDNSGRLMLTTVPEPLSGMVLSGRMNSSAFDNITRQNRRYVINSEHIGRKTFYSMYAPLLNNKGECQAIVCAPYTDNSFDFRQDAVMHTAALLTVFLILLLLARITSSTILDRLFFPISEIGRRMKEADLDNPEHIEYDGNDELTGLVLSYNRMVDDLSASSHKLLLAERDRAWNGMARQVAHEIKNPLTPMKLQLQRLVRLKSNGDPRWMEMFDEVSAIVLEHIDILTDTANEFSELAKLPTEKMTPIDLAQLLKEEITMFEGREEVSFEYIGLDSAQVSGPRPQLTRVVVNLLTNAVQAVEEGVESGSKRVVVTLCLSSESGFYDITVEDNGPGVSADNLQHLFTPSFTTKSGGSGLGLAISRSILDRCGATISYSRSFSLSGACFCVKYPILQQ